MLLVLVQVLRLSVLPLCESRSAITNQIARGTQSGQGHTYSAGCLDRGHDLASLAVRLLRMESVGTLPTKPGPWIRKEGDWLPVRVVSLLPSSYRLLAGIVGSPAVEGLKEPLRG